MNILCLVIRFIILIFLHIIQREYLLADYMEDLGEETYPLTEIDRIANANDLLVLKALLSFLPGGDGLDFALLIKLMEIRNIQSYYRNRSRSEICAMSARTFSASELLQKLMLYCPKEQRENLEQLRNIMDMAQMFGTMQDMFGGEMYGESEQSAEQSAEKSADSGSNSDILDQ